MGLWYGSEIIMHHESEAYETTYDSCVVVHLADVNEVSFALFIPLYQSISTPSRPANTFFFGFLAYHRSFKQLLNSKSAPTLNQICFRAQVV